MVPAESAGHGRGAERRPRRTRHQERAERPLTVLVADDEELIQRALSRLLSGRGHAVHTASDAYEAAALLERLRFDVVVVDRRMPGDGRSVLRALAQRSDFKGRAILMTGAFEADPNQELGQDVLLVRKPFDFSTMVDLVEGGRPG